MTPRVLYSYKCHTCKKVKEPSEYRENFNTGYVRVNCDSCYEKREARERRAREERLEREEQERLREEDRIYRARIRENFPAAEARERENNVVDSDIEERESLIPVVEIVESSESMRELADRICAAENEVHTLMKSPLYNLNNVSFGYGR